MKIGEWDNLGRARELLHRQLGELAVDEIASHVTLNQDNGRLRIVVATDAGLLDYSYAPSGSDLEGAWMLRGQLIRWPSVKGLRLQTEAQLEDSGEIRDIWRLVAEEPKLELSGHTGGTEDHAVGPLLAFATACLQRAG